MLYQAQISKEEQTLASPSSSNNDDHHLDGGGIQVTCFSEAINDVPIHFQIIRLPKQVFHGLSNIPLDFSI